MTSIRVFVCVATVLFALVSELYSEEVVRLANGQDIVVLDDHTWVEVSPDTSDASTKALKDLQKFLRKGREATPAEIDLACQMYDQGWRFTMPMPKSAQAGWGHRDGRTTWWYGYWYNTKTERYSASTPVKNSGGVFVGDFQIQKGSYRNGGSPGVAGQHKTTLLTG